ncbi:hypothetical protein [Chitinophaga sp. LS1]|uniref:hypothetical protein n=1 Tax=Chitinophaga sp. LS1 TaxID=3051176 RepID=UPI0039F0474B
MTKTELATRLDISNAGITQLFSGRVPSATVLTNLRFLWVGWKLNVTEPFTE